MELFALLHLELKIKSKRLHEKLTDSNYIEVIGVDTEIQICSKGSKLQIIHQSHLLKVMKV